MSYFDHLAFSKELRASPMFHGLMDLDTPRQATYPDVKSVYKNEVVTTTGMNGTRPAKFMPWPPPRRLKR